MVRARPGQASLGSLVRQETEDLATKAVVCYRFATFPTRESLTT